jgi:hypothetical protein
MTKVVDASDFIRRKNAENNFTVWFDKTFGSCEARYMKVIKEVIERFSREAWDKCAAIWRGRYNKVKENIADAIELCRCDNSDCESCKILKSLLMQNYN